MKNHPQSDEEIANEERRRAKLWSRTTLWSLLFWIAFALLLVLAFNFNIPQRLGAGARLSAWLDNWFPMILLVFVWIAFLVYRRRFRPNPAIERPGVQRRLVDDYTRRQRWTLLLFVLVMIILSQTLPPQSAPQTLGDWYTASLFVLIALVAAFSIVLGPGFLNKRFRAARADESSRTLRGRAAQFGYVFAMAVMGADFLLGLAAPQWLTRVIPLSMAAVFIIPALYFLWADWRASLSDEGRDG
jgi:magnesium-transporting ATPase (P-type)